MSSDYELPDEKSTLVITIICILFILGSVLYVSISTAVGFTIAGLIYIRLKQGQILGNSAKVTGAAFRHLDKLMDDASSRLQVIRPNLFVFQNPFLNAFVLGFSHPYSMVLHSSILEHLDEDELLFIIGHEAGHIKSGHAKILSLISPIGNTNPIISFLFGFWQRKAEYSADRAGIIVGQKLSKAISALIKISVGPGACKYVSFDDLSNQARLVDYSLPDKLGELISTHPYIINRIRKLIEFVESDNYRRLINKPSNAILTGNICPNCKSNLPALKDSAFCLHCGY